MAKIEYSRLIIKRTDIGGVVPTIPTDSTIPDDSWIATDIMVGEFFSNVADDRMWFRTDNGIIEIPMSGLSSQNYFTTGATLVGNTVWFDRNDALSAYSIDLSAIISTAVTGNYLPLSGGVMDAGAEILSTDSNKFIRFGIDGFSDDALIIGNNIDILSPPISGITSYGVYYPSIASNGFEQHTTDFTNGIESVIGMDITGGLSSPIDLYINDNIGGAPNRVARIDLSTWSTRVYNQEQVSITSDNLLQLVSPTIFLNSDFTGTSVVNLGLDENGNITTGTTGGGGAYLPLSGGTMDSGAQISGATGNYLDLDFGGAGAIALLDSPFTGPTSSNGLVIIPGFGNILNSSSDNNITSSGDNNITSSDDNNITSSGNTNITSFGDNNMTSGGDLNLISNNSLKLTSNNGYIDCNTDGGFIISDISLSHQFSFVHIPTSTNAISTSSSTKGKTIISSEGAIVNAGVYNTVILGGINITATQNNTVYVPNLVSNGIIRKTGYTVATLPTGSTVGDTAYVTDALAPTYLGIAVGGGAVVAPVFFNGTNWIT